VACRPFFVGVSHFARRATLSIAATRKPHASSSKILLTCGAFNFPPGRFTRGRSRA
jgi:hypothetical protein